MNRRPAGRHMGIAKLDEQGVSTGELANSHRWNLRWKDALCTVSAPGSKMTLE
jgi:hypothetical protein